MSRSDEIPGSIRIRTDENNQWRYDEIERAAEYYDCNRSNAAAFACHDVTRMAAAVKQVLERDDLTRQQRREIAATLSTGNLRFDVSTAIAVDRDRGNVEPTDG